MRVAAREVREQDERAAPDAQPAGVLVVARSRRRRPAGARAGRAGARRSSSRRPSGSPSRVSLEASNVAGSCGSGTSRPRNSANAANSRRRPSRVAVAMSSSMWSEKNWNGAVLAVLLALEEHRRERRQQRAQRRERPRLDGQPVAERAVADLVVVGGEDDEALGRDVVGAGAEAPVAERRVRAVVHVRAVERLREVGDGAELGVVALAVAGQQDAQRVVEVVGPGGVAAPAAADRRRA